MRVTNSPHLVSLCLIVSSLFLSHAGEVSAADPVIDLEPVATSLSRPVGITHAGDGSGRLFIVELTGEIRIVDAAGDLLPTSFLDIGAQSACCGEQGLLGLAFHPNYSDDGYFYVHYSDLEGDTVVSRFTVSANPDVADPGSELVLLTLAQPYTNHNGGQIEFGPDGYLYIALGDGGSGGDPGDRAQNLGLLFGKILRIDVDTADPPLEYSIPADNPFVGAGGPRQEIWAYGLRNPWRFSFDRLTGDLFIGDVGQFLWEEINMQPAASTGGENWGWRCYEGDAVYNSSGCGPIGDYEFPILTYAHAGGNCSVSGGYRYRGTNYPNLWGTYLFGDYCTGKVWGGTYDGMAWSATEFYDLPASLSSFGEDEDGELYLAAYASSGTVYRIVDLSDPGVIFFDGFENGTTDGWTSATP